MNVENKIKLIIGYEKFKLKELFVFFLNNIKLFTKSIIVEI